MSLKSSIKDIGKHSLIYIVGWGIAYALRIALLPVFTRYINSSDYGTLSILDSSIELLRVLCALGLGAAVARYYNESADPEQRRTVMSTGASLTVIITSAAALLVYPFSKTISGLIFGAGSDPLNFQLAFGAMLFSAIRGISDTYLAVNKKSLLFVLINLLQAIFQALVNLSLVVLLKLGLLGMLIGNVISAAIFGGALYLYVVWHNGLSIRKELLMPMLKFGLPLVPCIWAATLMHNMDRFFIRHYSHMEEVGLYSLAYQFPFMLGSMLMGSFTRIWESSSIYEIAKSADARLQYSRICTYSMSVLAFALLGVSLMSEPIVTLLAAPSYLPAHRYIPVLALGVWGYSLHNFVRVGINVTKKTHVLTLNYILTVVYNLALNMLLIPKWGAMGAAWASVGTYFGFSVGGALIYRYWCEVRVEWLRLGKVLGVAVLLVLVKMLLLHGVTLTSVAGEIALIALFPVMLAFGTDFLVPEEKEYLREWLLRIKSFCRNKVLPEPATLAEKEGK